MAKLRSMWVLVAAAMLAGCAAPLKKQAFNREAAQALRTVAVTQQVNQDSYEAAVLGHPASSFGLIGGLIAVADISAKSARLTNAIHADETRLQERFAMAVEQGLRDAGYEASRVMLPKDATSEQALEIARKHGPSDAILDSQVIAAYWAAGPATSYLPRVLAKVRLLDTRTGATLFEDTFTYGYSAPQLQTVHFAADARYSYTDIEALTADPPTTREGLYEGVKAIVAQIVTDLKR